MDPHFVDLQQFLPELQMDIRYAGTHNLTGHPLAGYCAPKALLTRDAAEALVKAHTLAAKFGYGFLIYDAYRPQKAVDDFVRWSGQPEDHLTKAEFYPTLEKETLFPLGYIALKSGHTRGSTIDLTLTRNRQPIDMGTSFDFMNDLSHHRANGLTEEQTQNRSTLCAIMAWAGFEPYGSEWWHYRLMNEPFPDTYFNFDIE